MEMYCYRQKEKLEILRVWTLKLQPRGMMTNVLAIFASYPDKNNFLIKDRIGKVRENCKVSKITHSKV